MDLPDLNCVMSRDSLFQIMTMKESYWIFCNFQLQTKYNMVIWLLQNIFTMDFYKVNSYIIVIIIPTLFKKKHGYIIAIASVRLSRYVLGGRAMAQSFFCPAPGEGPKGQISLNFNCKVNFKDF